jgi:predicted kinase
MATPTLVVVSGTPGSGKTRLARAIAGAMPCPVISRDEIKEGMAHAHGPAFGPAPGDPLTLRTNETFFEVLRVLLVSGVSVVAEAAFQNQRWSEGLEPLSSLARLRIVHCVVDADLARDRVARRLADGEVARSAHADEDLLERLEAGTEPEPFESFDRLSLPAPSIVVDTTDGYEPELAEILEFIDRPDASGA